MNWYIWQDFEHIGLLLEILSYLKSKCKIKDVHKA